MKQTQDCNPEFVSQEFVTIRKVASSLFKLQLLKTLGEQRNSGLVVGIWWTITCSWHQKNETTNSPIQQFTNLKCCKMSFKAFKMKKQALKCFLE